MTPVSAAGIGAKHDWEPKRTVKTRRSCCTMSPRSSRPSCGARQVRCQHVGVGVDEAAHRAHLKRKTSREIPKGRPVSGHIHVKGLNRDHADLPLAGRAPEDSKMARRLVSKRRAPPNARQTPTHLDDLRCCAHGWLRAQATQCARRVGHVLGA